jgi:hypothetical protein
MAAKHRRSRWYCTASAESNVIFIGLTKSMLAVHAPLFSKLQIKDEFFGDSLGESVPSARAVLAQATAGEFGNSPHLCSSVDRGFSVQ